VTPYSNLLSHENWRVDDHQQSQDGGNAPVIATPEPSTLVIAVTMATIIGGYSYFRRGKANRPASR
jgi:hypothetical protein